MASSESYYPKVSQFRAFFSITSRNTNMHNGDLLAKIYEHGSDHGYTCDLLHKPSKFESNKLQKEKPEVIFDQIKDRSTQHSHLQICKLYWFFTIVAERAEKAEKWRLNCYIPNHSSELSLAMLFYQSLKIHNHHILKSKGRVNNF